LSFSAKFCQNTSTNTIWKNNRWRSRKAFTLCWQKRGREYFSAELLEQSRRNDAKWEYRCYTANTTRTGKDLTSTTNTKRSRRRVPTLYAAVVPLPSVSGVNSELGLSVVSRRLSLIRFRYPWVNMSTKMCGSFSNICTPATPALKKVYASLCAFVFELRACTEKADKQTDRHTNRQT